VCYVVKAAAAVVRVGDQRREVYLYRGAPVPAEAMDESVQHLLQMGLIVEDTPPVAPGGKPEQTSQAPEVQDGDEAKPDLSSMNLDQLRAYAADHGIDLAGATRKDDIIAAITAA